MGRKEGVKREHAAQRRIAQHQTIQEILAQIAQPFATARSLDAEAAIVNRGPKQDSRQRLASSTQSKRQRQRQQVEREKEAGTGAAAPEMAAHRPPASEGSDPETTIGAQSKFEWREWYQADALTHIHRHGLRKSPA